MLSHPLRFDITLTILRFSIHMGNSWPLPRDRARWCSPLHSSKIFRLSLATAPDLCGCDPLDGCSLHLKKNNDNDFPERKIQVSLMGLIYSYAKWVLIWLGSQVDGSEEYFDSCNQIPSDSQSLRPRILKNVDSDATNHASVPRPPRNLHSFSLHPSIGPRKT